MIYLHQKRGFTLIEIVVVITVIGILGAIVLANMQGGKAKGRDTQRVSDIEQVRLALRLLRDANSSDYPTYNDGIEIGTGSAFDSRIQRYVTGTIKDPLDGQSGYRYYYDSSYTCNGTVRTVLIALTMEGGGNYASVCGAQAQRIGGVGTPTPGANSYIVILK